MRLAGRLRAVSRRSWGRAARDFVTGKEEGHSGVEYALLIVLLALACVTAMSLLGNDIGNFFNNVGNLISNSA
jgi:Flp pilus assembly pilin Flp